jgi:hypothetical protein
MFSELLSNTDESIFLQAVDEYFDKKKSINTSSDDVNTLSSPSSSSSSTTSEDDDSIEAYLEDLNVKFYESLNESNDKDISTEDDSDESDSYDNSIKKMFVKSFIKENINELIEKEITKVKGFYIEQIEVRKKIKEMFNMTVQKENKTGSDNKNNKRQK